MGGSDWLVVAISGCTCSGKTTVSEEIQKTYPSSVILHQDDCFHDVSSDKHTKVPELNHLNFELLSSLDNDKFLGDVRGVLDAPGDEKGKRLLILEGFLVLNEPRLVELCDLKFFIASDRDTCWARRSVRTYEPPDPPGYFDLCVWPAYLEHYKEVVDTVTGVTFLDSGKQNLKQLEEQVLSEIKKHL